MLLDGRRGHISKAQSFNSETEVSQIETVLGILIPFLGTTLGAACVFFMKMPLGNLVQRSLAGFAAGVMVAASIWSLLIPAIEQSTSMGRWSFFPALAGFWAGVLFLLILDHLIPHLHVGSDQSEGPKSTLSRTTMMVLAVTLHNIPEGMAVGVYIRGLSCGKYADHGGERTGFVAWHRHSEFPRRRDYIDAFAG